MMEISSALDESKENVQPLRKGRRADHFGTVLQAQISNEAQMELDQQRQQYELAIRLYDGEDPLEPRYEFAHWIEQSYPTLGPESKLIDLLEDTVNIYKDDDRYKQDPRFVEMLIKYINSQLNSLELYQLAYNQGLGTMCAILYLAWAEELDQQQDYKRANQVYELGVMAHAEPLEDLKSKQEQFQLSVGRRMLSGDQGRSSSPEPVIEPARQVLSKLHKSSITGTRVAKSKPGVLHAHASVFEGNNKRNSALTIFQDENEGGIASGSVKSQLDHFPKQTVTNKENALKPGPWTKKSSNATNSSNISSYVIGSSRNAAVVSSARTIPLTPSFQIHEDEGKEDETPHQAPIVPRVLKPIRSEAGSCPPTIFEHSDPSVKVMYPKHKVYVGGREFQLEEIKAAQYFKQHNLDCSQGGVESRFQTPMIFRKNQGLKQIDCTPSPMLRSAPIRLFADTPGNSPGELTPIGAGKCTEESPM